MPKPKLAFYCQYVSGVGHLNRALLLIRELVRDFEVHLLIGGPRIPYLDFRHPDLVWHFLSPIHSETFLEGQDRKVFQARERELARISADFCFAGVVTELFPFGRKKFREEVLAFLAAVKRKNPECRVIASMRDIFVARPKQEKYERQVIACIAEFYDRILVHSDPEILPLERSFAQTEPFREKIRYTGYVVEAIDRGAEVAKEVDVIVSNGGGGRHDGFLLQVAQAARALPEFSFAFYLGKFTGEGTEVELRASVAGLPNVQVSGAVSNFRERMRAAKLSISLGGYNTVMNLLGTSVRGLVLPCADDNEQSERLEIFAKLGLLEVLRPADLNVERLAARIRTELHAEPRQVPISLEMDGAANTRLALSTVVSPARIELTS